MKLKCLIPALLLAFASRAVAADHRLVVRGDRLFIPVTVNGRHVEALLDSAAEATIIDDDLANMLGLALSGNETVKGSGGEDTVHFAEGVNIRAAETDLKGLTVAVLDLEDLSKRLVGTKISLILGREFFDAGRFKLDIERGKILRLKTTARPKGMMLPLVTHRGIEEFPVRVEGNDDVQATFDLGNGSEMMIGRQTAGRLGISVPARVIERKKGGGIGGSIDRDIVTLSRVTIAGRTFANVRAAIDDLDSQSEANVGVNLLRHFVIVTDFPGHKLWLDSR
jgi:predicted aspartyl protease